jgi:hypothetical protein
LFNILPEPIVRRLERDQSAIAEGFDRPPCCSPTSGFTPISAGSRRALVDLLNGSFALRCADGKAGLEKIKTIGGRLHGGGRDADAAQQSRAGDCRHGARDTDRREHAASYRRSAEARIINTGPVVAGVIGTKIPLRPVGRHRGTPQRVGVRRPVTIQLTERTASSSNNASTSSARPDLGQRRPDANLSLVGPAPPRWPDRQLPC